MDCKYRADLLAERKFTCPNCGGLFDVCHDFSHISDINKLKQTFDERMVLHKCPAQLRSGVWRYHELVMPHLPQESIISLGEGNVPIVHAGRNLCQWVGTENLWIILEGMTPTGSFKDFGMTVLVSIAKAAGINALGCSSTGDTSAAVSAYAGGAGMKSLVILPAGKVTAVQLAQPLVHGAVVVTLPGNFDECMRVMRELVEKYGVYPANSLNPARIEGHQATSFQIAHFFNWKMPEWIVVPVGNGSNCSSVGKGMRLLRRLGFVEETSRILGCQSEAANPLSLSWLGRKEIASWKTSYKPIQVGETTATAARIGNPVSYKKVMREVIDSMGRMTTATEEDLNEAVAICGKDGIFVCPQTGIALAGLRNCVRGGTIFKEETAVVVSTATGLKFTDSAARHLEKNVISASDCQTETVAKILRL